MNGLTMGDYVIGTRVGSGGVGDVYRATDTMLEREVAIKFLRPGFGTQQELVQRFRAEARTLAQLHHPNIATLYSLHREGETLAMVMELVDGITVSSLLAAHGALPIPIALAIFLQALEGIGCAHTHGVIHRDIKPSNLMLNRAGVLKVMDFGIARCAGTSRVTRAGNTVGTAQYMSPEQVQGSETDTQSDIYSLCIVLYEMLTDRLPFSSEVEYEVMRAQVEEIPPPPRGIVPEIPEAIEAAILRGLRKPPSERFASTDALRDALLIACLDSLELTASDLAAVLQSWAHTHFAEHATPVAQADRSTDHSQTELLLQTQTGLVRRATGSAPRTPHDSTLDKAFAILESGGVPADAADAGGSSPPSADRPADGWDSNALVHAGHTGDSAERAAAADASAGAGGTTVWELPELFGEDESASETGSAESPRSTSAAISVPATTASFGPSSDPTSVTDAAECSGSSSHPDTATDTASRPTVVETEAFGFSPSDDIAAPPAAPVPRRRSLVRVGLQASALVLILLSMGAPSPRGTWLDDELGSAPSTEAASPTNLEPLEIPGIPALHIPLPVIIPAAVEQSLRAAALPAAPDRTSTSVATTSPKPAPRRTRPTPKPTPRHKPARPAADEKSDPQRFAEPNPESNGSLQEDEAGEWVLRR